MEFWSIWVTSCQWWASYEPNCCCTKLISSETVRSAKILITERDQGTCCCRTVPLKGCSWWNKFPVVNNVVRLMIKAAYSGRYNLNFQDMTFGCLYSMDQAKEIGVNCVRSFFDYADKDGVSVIWGQDVSRLWRGFAWLNRLPHLERGTHWSLVLSFPTKLGAFRWKICGQSEIRRGCYQKPECDGVHLKVQWRTHRTKMRSAG